MVKIIVHIRPSSDNVKSVRIHSQAPTMSEAVEQVEKTYSEEFRRKRIIKVEYIKQKEAANA